MKTPADIPEEKILLRYPEAAEALGLSRSTIYELVAKEELPVVRVGRAVRIPVSALKKWAASKAASGAHTEA